MSSGDGTVIGGDFYDLFQDSAHHAEVVLGDVCGKGPAAAVVAVLARHTARAFSEERVDPSAVLSGIHRAISRHHPDRYCTAVMLRLLIPTKEDGNRRRIKVAVGGHYLPLCRRAEGRYEALGVHGSILGMVSQANVEDREAELSPGDLVVLYTDGVTEARNPEGTFYGEARLRQLLDTYADETAQKLANVVVEEVLAFQGGEARDDIALVVVRPS
jgi:phosphoserine phosphatase RsbU/P